MRYLIEGFNALFLMEHLTAAKEHRELDFVTLLNELAGVIDLDL